MWAKAVKDGNLQHRFKPILQDDERPGLPGLLFTWRSEGAARPTPASRRRARALSLSLTVLVNICLNSITFINRAFYASDRFKGMGLVWSVKTSS